MLINVTSLLFQIRSLTFIDIQYSILMFWLLFRNTAFDLFFIIFSFSNIMRILRVLDLNKWCSACLRSHLKTQDSHLKILFFSGQIGWVKLNLFYFHSTLKRALKCAAIIRLNQWKTELSDSIHSSEISILPYFWSLTNAM